MLKMLSPKVLLLVNVFIVTGVLSAVKNYELHIKEAAVTKAGFELKSALTISLQDDDKGTIPAPQLNFHLGDDAVIKVVNHTKEITSMHWHGILLPANMDGPMFFNNLPILPGESFTFRFPIKHTGTYWYHSHTEYQEQRGLYGAIVIKDPNKVEDFTDEHVLVLSDWSTESPAQIMKNIKANGHHYELKKDSQTSIWGAIRHGAVLDYIMSEWTRMGTMDLSDVGYDAFLINGEASTTIKKHYHPKSKIKLRIINAGASSFFYINIGKVRIFEVVAKDGVEVKPVSVSEVLMGMGETYDLVFEIPKHGTYEVRATAQDVTGKASFILGKGTHIETVPDKLKPNPYVMDHEGHDGGHGGHDGGAGDHGGHDDGGGHDDHGDDGNDEGGHDGHESDNDEDSHDGHGGHESAALGFSDDDEDEDFVKLRNKILKESEMVPMVKRLNYSMLESLEETAYDSKLPRYDLTLNLDGSMDRYTWDINGKQFSKDPYIEVNEGDVVRFTMVNKTMMHHPMHLHGHFFRLLNSKGAKSPLVHTVDVGPMKTQTIEFLADNPGIWFFHCHNLYHMKMGMARLIKYRKHKRPKELMDSQMKHMKKFTHDNTPFLNKRLSMFTNNAAFEVDVDKGKNEFKLKLELSEYDPDTFEAEAVFKKHLTKYFSLIAGVEYEDEDVAGLLGIEYLLPLRLESRVYAKTDESVVVELEKHFPLTSKLKFLPNKLELTPEVKSEFKDNEKPKLEVETTLMYQLNEWWKLGLFYKYENRDDDGGDKDSHSIGAGFIKEL